LILVNLNELTQQLYKTRSSWKEKSLLTFLFFFKRIEIKNQKIKLNTTTNNNYLNIYIETMKFFLNLKF